MPDKYIIQRRTASGLETVAELPALENGKINLSWLPVVGNMGSAIIEHGSNANGEYVRWADGTQVCWGTFYYSFNMTDTAQIIEQAFPAAFLDGPISGAAYHNNAPGRAMICGNFFPTRTVLRLSFTVIDGLPTSTVAVPIRWLAIGRWK